MMQMQNEKGAGKLTVIVFAAIVGIALFLIYNILPFYYYYYELQNHFDSAIRVASTNTDAELRRKLSYHIKKMQIPVDPEDLVIERDGQNMRIGLAYTEVFYLTWQDKDYDIYEFPFYAYSEGRY